MRCPRCGTRLRGASWYCPGCGFGTEDLAADIVLSQRRRLRLGVLAGALAVALGLAAWLAANPAGDVEPPPVVVAPTATAFVEATATPVRVPSRPEAAPSPSQPAATGSVAPTESTPRPTPRLREGSPLWNAVRLSEPPVLDGWLDDWRAPSQDLAALIEGEAAWQGAADLSARALLGWDDEALYVGVRAFDDAFVIPPPGADMDGGDHVLVQLDADLYGDWDARTYDIDDWLIGLSPGDFGGDLGGRAAEGHVWRPRLEAAGRIRTASRRLADGYTLEAAIGWDLIGLSPPRYAVMGFALSVVDRDGEGPATVVATTPGQTLDDPRTLGALAFD